MRPGTGSSDAVSEMLTVTRPPARKAPRTRASVAGEHLLVGEAGAADVDADGVEGAPGGQTSRRTSAVMHSMPLGIQKNVRAS